MRTGIRWSTWEVGKWVRLITAEGVDKGIFKASQTRGNARISWKGKALVGVAQHGRQDGLRWPSWSPPESSLPSWSPLGPSGAATSGATGKLRFPSSNGRRQKALVSPASVTARMMRWEVSASLFLSSSFLPRRETC